MAALQRLRNEILGDAVPPFYIPAGSPRLPPLLPLTPCDLLCTSTIATHDGPFICMGAQAVGIWRHIAPRLRGGSPDGVTSKLDQIFVHPPPTRCFRYSQLNCPKPIPYRFIARPKRRLVLATIPSVGRLSHHVTLAPTSSSATFAPGSLKKTYDPLGGDGLYFGHDLKPSVEPASPKDSYRKFKQPSMFRHRKAKAEEIPKEPGKLIPTESKYWKKLIPAVRKGDMVIRQRGKSTFLTDDAKISPSSSVQECSESSVRCVVARRWTVPGNVNTIVLPRVLFTQREPAQLSTSNCTLNRPISARSSVKCDNVMVDSKASTPVAHTDEKQVVRDEVKPDLGKDNSEAAVAVADTDPGTEERNSIVAKH
eukprot:GEMP01048146.1.p1 GENE.GEMP01048146.1~~GEMP01048146.1.p1  ORF type:complete len:367 (+),score=64.78 GEMP01048146.1:82-1182(+)